MSHRSRLSGVRVLVVDDARYVLDVVTDMLQCNGANVTAVDSAEEALDILQRERPDVLLSDLSMPGCPARRLLVDRTGACAVAGPGAAPRPLRHSPLTPRPNIVPA